MDEHDLARLRIIVNNLQNDLATFDSDAAVYLLIDVAHVVAQSLGEPSYGITNFIQGISAGFQGEDPRLCPFDKMTREHAEWQRGHHVGSRINREHE